MHSIDNAERWIFARRPSPTARVRLLCFPHAGGSASTFRPWPSLLAPDIDVYSVQLPGRENRLGERPFSHLSALVKTLVRVLEPITQQPFALFGYSVGALIAFELSRALRACGARPPSHLLVAGRLAPHVPALTPRMHDLPDAEFLTELRRLNGTSPEVLANQELMRLMTPLLRADFAISDTHHYVDAPPLDCPISVFAGDGDPGAPPNRMLEWQQQTTSRFRLHTLTGDHFFVLREAPEVTSRISADLRKTLKIATQHDRLRVFERANR